MPNIANVLKSEIARVARKEVRGETLSLKKATAAYRREIAALKRRTDALEKLVNRLQRRSSSDGARVEASDADAAPGRRRFSAKGLASTRRRLGLSAQDCGLLVGASSQSVYNWEEGKARPREKHLPAIAALKSLGKRAANERLAELKAA